MIGILLSSSFLLFTVVEWSVCSEPYRRHHDFLGHRSSRDSQVNSDNSLYTTTSDMKLHPTELEAMVIDNGWSMGYFFTGDNRHIVDASAIPRDYFQQVHWFSQLRQDYLVSELLQKKRNGYFVDLAANDAIRISNTYGTLPLNREGFLLSVVLLIFHPTALERYFNWTGLCVEANSMYWSSLSYRKCTLIGAVVGRTRMEEVVFKFSSRKGPQSGIVGTEYDNQLQDHPINSSFIRPNKEYQRRSTVTLTEILDIFQSPKVIDYLSLDLEGAEYYALEDFAFDRYLFCALTIERPTQSLKVLLQQHGYVMLRDLRQWGETLWIHQGCHDRLEHNQSKLQAIVSMDIPKYSERLLSRKPQGDHESSM